jgi:glycosyltransferase involved in cell wall biosynthesis
MRIALFGTISGHGGIQRHVRTTAEILAEAGCEVLVLSSILESSSTGGQSVEGETDELVRHGVRIHWLPKQAGAVAMLRETFRLGKLVRKFRPDILLGTGLSWHMGLLPLFLPGRVRKIFFEVMSGESTGSKDPRRLVAWFFDEVVGQAQRVSQTFASSFHWRKKLCTIRAFPEALEVTARLPTVQKHRVATGMVRAGFFSRLVEGKQAFWLVRQWESLKDFVSVLHIHGHGPEREAIDAWIVAHGLTDRIRCFGAYPTGQAYADLLCSYDVTLLPTIFPEGAPLVLLESMACGVPFVANGVGGVPDYGTDNPDCIVVPEQSEFLAGVRRMAGALDRGEIDQARLQGLYFDRYSRKALRRDWLACLGVPESPDPRQAARPAGGESGRA